MSMQNAIGSILTCTALLTVNPASAVDCSTESLQAAIDDLYPVGVGVINVTGTCNEAITIAGFRDLTINGDSTAIIQPGSLQDGIQVAGGSSVKVCGLTVYGGKTGIVVAGAQVENIGTCGAAKGLTVTNAGLGIAVIEHGAFQSRNGVPLTVANNTAEGIFVTSGSRLNIQGLATEASVANNGGNGIYVGEGATALLFHTKVRNNGGSGVVGVMGAVVHLASSEVTGNTSWGVILSNNVTGQILSDASATSTVSSNGGGGVLVTQRSALRLKSAPVVNGNTGSNLTCSIGGDAYGDASNIPNAKRDCKSLEAVPLPG